MLIQLVKYHVRISSSTDLYNNPDTITVRLISQIRDTYDLFLPDK